MYDDEYWIRDGKIFVVSKHLISHLRDDNFEWKFFSTTTITIYFVIQKLYKFCQCVPYGFRAVVKVSVRYGALCFFFLFSPLTRRRCLSRSFTNRRDEDENRRRRMPRLPTVHLTTMALHLYSGHWNNLFRFLITEAQGHRVKTRMPPKRSHC